MTRTIAIIDDSLLVLKLTRVALEHAGFHVATYADPGDFAFDASCAPALVLVDINMPQFYGDDLVSYFKDTLQVGAPIYLFSDVSEKDLHLAVKRSGADGFISKHWGVEELIVRVERIVGTASRAAVAR